MFRKYIICFVLLILFIPLCFITIFANESNDINNDRESLSNVIDESKNINQEQQAINKTEKSLYYLHVESNPGKLSVTADDNVDIDLKDILTIDKTENNKDINNKRSKTELSNE